MPEKPFFQNPRVWIFCLTLLASAVILYFYFMSDLKNKTDTPRNESKPPIVSYINVVPDSYASCIRVFGEAVPEKELQLSFFVSGKIIWVSKHLKPGCILEKGEPVARIENGPYLARVARARLELARADLDFLTEKKEARQAQKNWQISGLSLSKAPALALRQPQLAAARARAEAARAELDAALIELEDCVLKSPFKALVVENPISEGQYIQAFDPAAAIQDIQTAVVEIHLSQDQRSLLPEDRSKIRVRLIDDRENTWSAAIKRQSHHLDRDSRLLTLFCEVSRPLQQTPPLLPGAFLTVELTGEKIDNLLRIPESCMTRQGKVWMITPEDRLDAFDADPVFYRNGFIFTTPKKSQVFPLKIARFPTGGFIRGLKVQSALTTSQG